MQVALTAEEMEVVKKIVGNDGLRRAVFTCEECKHYHQHYVKGTPENIAPYTDENRVDGTWEVLSVSEAANAAQEVKNKFTENSDSHLIEFACGKDYEFYDNLTIRTKEGRVLNSYISAIRKSSERTKTVYKSGELRIMLDEKINMRLGGK